MEIRGGRRLSGGRVSVAGSSNQVTKCIIASLLTNDDVMVRGAPEVSELWLVANADASLDAPFRTHRPYGDGVAEVIERHLR